MKISNPEAKLIKAAVAAEFKRAGTEFGPEIGELVARMMSSIATAIELNAKLNDLDSELITRAFFQTVGRLAKLHPEDAFAHHEPN